jgi:hypothetical protein
VRLGIVFAGLGLSALRFIVAVIAAFGLALAVGPDIAPVSFGGAENDGELLVIAVFGLSLLIVLG